jgi:beta-lactamase superfamily II metal-dependent hydrolase
LIQADGLFALIDGGDNDDEQTVVRYLQDQSVTTLAYVFATHLHADHIGGLDAVANNFPIGTLLVSNGDADTRTYSDFITAMANRGVNPSVPLPGSTYALGTTSIQVLSAADTDDVNDNSLVLEWTNGADNALFLGDASSTIETSLQVADSIELIKIGHHGSSTSTDPTFLRALNPDYAVITAGAGNSYGHPHQETVTTLQDQAIELHRTDECGTILFTSTGSGLSTTSAPASYAAGANSTGAKPSTSGNPAKGGTSLAPLPSSPSATNPSSATPLAADQTETQTDDTTQTVYWTPNGEVYHTTDKCSSFSRSKTILSGTIQDSGKPRVCKICG